MNQIVTLETRVEEEPVTVSIQPLTISPCHSYQIQTLPANKPMVGRSNIAFQMDATYLKPIHTQRSTRNYRLLLWYFSK